LRFQQLRDVLHLWRCAQLPTPIRASKRRCRRPATIERTSSYQPSKQSQAGPIDSDLPRGVHASAELPPMPIR
jgi:hypothetical protein